MFRHSPRRNGRNRGLKIKHVLQISVLLGVSLWLLYQLHHPHDKKLPETTTITQKSQNDSDSDIIKLGRKDLRSKLKGTKEPEEHQADEKGEENEPEEHFQDHESEEGEDAKHEEAVENENADDGEDGIEKTNEMENEHEQIKAKMKRNDSEEAKVKENGNTGREQIGVKNEKTKENHKTERMKHNKHEGKHRESKNKVTKEEKEQETRIRSEKSKNEDEGGKTEVKEMQNTDRKEGEEEIKGKVNENKSNEQNKAVVLEKTNNKNVNKMDQNTKELVTSVPSEDHDQIIKEPNHEQETTSSKSADDSQNMPRTEKNGEADMDPAQPGSNPSQIETDEHNIGLNLSSNPTKDSEKEKQYEKVGNLSDSNTEKPINSINNNSSLDSYSMLSLEQEFPKSKIGNSPDSTKLQVPNSESVQNEPKNMINGESLERSEKNESFSGGLIPEVEKDARTDLGTLPESGTRGSSDHENGASE